MSNSEKRAQGNLLSRFYDTFCRSYINGILASEISQITRYADEIVQFQPKPDDMGSLLKAIDCPQKSTVSEIAQLVKLEDTSDKRSIILLNANLNDHLDVQGLLLEIKSKLNRSSRVVAVVYNSYWRWLYQLSNFLGIRKGELPCSFLTQRDITNLAEVSGYAVCRARPCIYFPMHLKWLGTLINRLMTAIPLFRWIFSLTEVLVLRPILPSKALPSLSVVIPARNEKGNIENALKRLETIGKNPMEIIFVEGNSNDGTWEEIQRVLPLYKDKFKLAALKQPGKGKNDAVRVGFAAATGDLLTILDADLTMPPELLHRFYDAYVLGHADFINGTRLVYPMEGEAMRFLNWLGNLFFAHSLSAVLDVRLSDSLCGTKLVTRIDYERMKRWRNDFGDFDPFGDFELLFPAAILGLGIVDIPIRYRSRTYGSTNIHRFRHGWILLKMTLTGLFRIRIGKGI